MGRIDVTQTVVLDSLLTRLRSQLGLNERQCYPTLDPQENVAPPGGDYWLTVAPGSSQYPPGEQTTDHLNDVWTVIVTIHSRMRMDPAGHAQEQLLNAVRGLWVIKGKVLKALIGQDLQDPTGNEFLRERLYIVRGTPGEAREDDRKGWCQAFMHLEFGVPFDWNLT
jgi:hypothetical protein